MKIRHSPCAIISERTRCAGAVMAERELFSVDRQGVPQLLKVVIVAPWQEDSGQWACCASITGSEGDDLVREVRGLDSWQALKLAFRFVIESLDDFTKSGGMLYCSKTAVPISAASMAY